MFDFLLWKLLLNELTQNFPKIENVTENRELVLPNLPKSKLWTSNYVYEIVVQTYELSANFEESKMNKSDLEFVRDFLSRMKSI